ncbi:hypothetical protein HER21_34325, partial [Pseudomonas sp. BGM005]|nr:hypothetical protein [Pseudomonas sp. BG5]
MSPDRQEAQTIDEEKTGRQKRRRRVWVILSLVVIVLLLAVCWVGLRAITVKDGLLKSQELLSD